MMGASRVQPVVFMLVAVFPYITFGQETELEARLKDLNVRVRTQHYAIAATSNISDRQLQEYGQALEFIYAQYAAGFSKLLNPATTAAPLPHPAKKPPNAKPASKKRSAAKTPADQPQSTPPPDAGPGGAPSAPEPFRVLIFGSEAEYQEFGHGYVGGGTEFTGGVCLSDSNVLLILDRGSLDRTRRVLFHEAFHQFMHRYVKNPPVWLNEGLATYYGSADLLGGQLRFDDPPADSWKLVRKLIEKQQAIPLWDIVQAGRADFYDATPVKLSGYHGLHRKTIYYAEAYTLIHTLLADPTGCTRVQDYIRDLAQAQGHNIDALTTQYFGPDVCEHMTPYWVKHVQDRPENR
jgi:hypothetical protein